MGKTKAKRVGKTKAKRVGKTKARGYAMSSIGLAEKKSKLSHDENQIHNQNITRQVL